MKPPTIVLFGSSGVGKTSLVNQICFKSFPEKHQPSIEDMYEHMTRAPDGLNHYIHILDTGGSLAFPAQEEVNIRNGQAFMIVYAINNQESFTKAVDQIRSIKQIKAHHEIPILLVGNKQDQEDNRVICKNTAERVAYQNGCIHVQTSAKQYSCVQDILDPLMSKLFSQNIKKSSKDEKKKWPLSSLVPRVLTRHKKHDKNGNNTESDSEEIHLTREN